MKEINKFLMLVGIFLYVYFVPFGSPRVSNAILEGFFMLQDYVREHTLTCLIPALFIAGAVSVKVSQASVVRYFGVGAKKIVSYGVASVSGTLLAVCSCTILPLFTGIYARGAGLGPAIAFVYSGPAINILAIVLTARVLGSEMGIARAIGAISFSILIGLVMALIFHKEESQRQIEVAKATPTTSLTKGGSPFKTILLFVSLLGVLLFATWAKPINEGTLFALIYQYKWVLTAISLLATIVIAFTTMGKDENLSWMEETWIYAKQIIPLLFIGVLVAGFLFGRPGHEGIIPSKYVESLVGGNSIFSNLFASVVGAFMYFATLTEIPILQGLMGSGMGKGPALALLLSGPALSLPNMLVIRSVIGTKKTVVYVLLVIVMSTIAGIIYGKWA
ncbi:MULTISPECIES: permease [Calditerrivibrio]|uniref:permease n=1 Tax=Calditerrivibrio TaxID=545865 RepID=UPI003C7287E7